MIYGVEFWTREYDDAELASFHALRFEALLRGHGYTNTVVDVNGRWLHGYIHQRDESESGSQIVKKEVASILALYPMVRDVDVVGYEGGGCGDITVTITGGK